MSRSSALLLFLLLAPFFAAGAPRGGKGGAPVPTEIDAARLREMLVRDSGRVVLVNAWASWCKPCRAEMPDLLTLRRTYGDRGLRLILISADDPELLLSDVVPALDSAGVDFPTYIARDSTEEAFINGLSPEWGGALPATFLYDRAGKRAAMFVGARSLRQFEEAILPLLGKGP